MSEKIAYRVLTALDTAALDSGVFRGSGLDLVDGFIHLSTASQLAQTVNLHFVGQDNLTIVAVDLQLLGTAVRWEASRNGQLFPHLYAPLTTDAVIARAPLQRAANGAVRLPCANSQGDIDERP